VRNALQSSRIQYERDIKLADDERRREEKKCLELSRQNEDLRKQMDKAVQDNLEKVAISHDLSMEKERLQRELDRVLRDQQRQKEALERDFDQRVNQKKLEHEKELLNERSKAAEVEKNLDKQVEDLKAEIVELNEEVGRKTVEITKIEADHSEKWIENENRWKTEYEEKHEHKQAVEDAIEEVNNKWRNKYLQLERESESKERGYKNEISHLENKSRDDLKENDGRWQLTLSQKQNEMDFVKESLEKNLEEANQKNSAFEAKFFREKLQLKNEAEMKLNEKVKELNVEFKKKLDERVDTLTSNLKYEMGQKEKDHQYKMQRKEMELATMAESLTRAQTMKSEIGKLMRRFNEMFVFFISKNCICY